MKKVLLITYHWPPSGGVTVLRCLKIVKYLREFGWEPVVLTAKNASYPFTDEGNFKDIPEGIEIIKVPIWEPVGWFKKLSGRAKNEPIQNITSTASKDRSWIDELSIWIRGNFFIPDARKFWIRPSVRYLTNYLKSNRIDAIFTDGPPHTNTVIGMRISRKTGIPWLADFQDPWTQVDYYKDFKISAWADKKHRKLEQEVFQTASKITIASDHWKTELESIGAKNVDVIYYGYDEDDFMAFKEKPHDKLVFFHGGVLGRDRNPENLFKVIAELRASEKEKYDHIAIRLAGEVDIEVKRSIKANGLTDITSYLGMLPRHEVYGEYANSDLLILPVNKADNAKGRIPAKLFEYLRTGKQILAFGPEDGDVARIIKEMQRGSCHAYSDITSIRKSVQQAIKNIETGQREAKDPSKYSNREQTRLVAKYLDEIS
jgi:hypothetical protein